MGDIDIAKKIQQIISEKDKNKLLLECMKGNEEYLKQSSLYELWKNDIPIDEKKFKYYLTNKINPFADDSSKVNIELVKFLLTNKLISTSFIDEYYKQIGPVLIVLFCKKKDINFQYLFKCNLEHICMPSTIEFLADALKEINSVCNVIDINDVFHASSENARIICYYLSFDHIEKIKDKIHIITDDNAEISKKIIHNMTNYYARIFKIISDNYSCSDEEADDIINYIEINSQSEESNLLNSLTYKDWEILITISTDYLKRHLISKFKKYIPNGLIEN